MSILSRALIIASLLLLSSAAQSDGIYNPHGGQVGFLDGISNLGAGTGGGGGGCTNNLDFSQSCNSMYLTTAIH